MIIVKILSICTFIAFCRTVVASKAKVKPHPIFSSCTGRGVTQWNRDLNLIRSCVLTLVDNEPRCFSLELESWLQGMVSVPERSASLYDNVTSLLYDPEDDSYHEHWFWVNDMYEEEYIEETDRSVRTVG